MAAAAEARDEASLAARFWDAQGEKVGEEQDERVRYLLAAAERIVDASTARANEFNCDARERIGVIERGTGFGLLSNDAMFTFETAAEELAGGELDGLLSISIGDCPLNSYGAQGLMHLFAAVIGMLAPGLKVRIVDHTGVHRRIMDRLNTHNYVALHPTFAGTFDVVVEGAQFNAREVDRAERAIVEHNALLIYPNGNAFEHADGSWIRQLRAMRRESFVYDEKYWAAGLVWQLGITACMAELFKRMPASQSAVLNAYRTALIPNRRSGFRTRGAEVDEAFFRNAVLGRLGDDSNGIRIWPTIFPLRCWFSAAHYSDHDDGKECRDRYLFLQNAHERCVAFQQRRALVVRHTVCPPNGGGAVLIAAALVPLVNAFLDHPIVPIPPDLIQAPDPSTKPLKTLIGRKRKAPSPATRPAAAAAAAAAAAPADEA